MANYCTADDIDARYSTENRTKWCSLGTTSAATITARTNLAIQDAMAYIDDRLRVSPESHRIPLTSVPASIRKICVMLAAYDMEAARGYSDFREMDGSTVPVTRLWADRLVAQEMLEMIVTGRMKLLFS